ncbi:HNH endonuclease [Paenibacillus sp. S02]|uniref:HNH endonuclease n=1 Tax=Paenibacillus sp. S02 TaxID=2823904 RepID=UPI001C64EC1C|nr:HNH endonuclease [Paenibacillus sp. S02]QYK68299.1 hypothetical protein KAI36_03450 [Paenibacillus sp. S02]
MANKYTYSVPFTEEELYTAYVIDGLSQDECAVRFGTTQKVIWRAMKKMGVPTRKAIKRNQYGENNSSWKGGRVLVNHKTPNGHRFLSSRNESKGYYMVRQPDHPHANKNGYVFEHIVVALKAAGREKLDPDECVHHIDFVRTNNSPENLIICSKNKHREYHGKLESLVGEMLDKGLVEFDSDLGYYIK